MSPMSTKKDLHLSIRITPEELQEIKEFAASNGMQQSEFVLGAIRMAMGKQGPQEQYIRLQEQYKQLTERLARLESKICA